MTAGSPRGPGTGEAGTVTAEFAIGLPAVVATVLLILAVILAGATKIECYEAARAGARVVMLGGSEPEAHQAARRVAGDQAHVAAHTADGWVTVEVAKHLGALPISVSAQLTAPVEPPG